MGKRSKEVGGRWIFLLAAPPDNDVERERVEVAPEETAM